MGPCWSLSWRQQCTALHGRAPRRRPVRAVGVGIRSHGRTALGLARRYRARFIDSIVCTQPHKRSHCRWSAGWWRCRGSPNRHRALYRLCAACDTTPAASRLPVPPGSEPTHVAASSQAAARTNLSSAAHKLAECPEMRNFSKVVRTTRQVCEPNRPCEPLGYLGHSGMRATRPHRPLCHTRRPTMGAARP